MDTTAGPKQTVFLVHGRDTHARKAVEALLRAFFLRVVPWERAVGWTGGAAPYTGDVVKTGITRSDAVVVLLTPDDVGHLRPELLTDRDERHEREPTGQPRMNVIFEAGMAMAHNRDTVVLVEVGAVRPMTDIAGVNVIRLDDTAERRRAFGRRLESAGLTVDWDNDDWLTAGTFAPAAQAAPAALASPPSAPALPSREDTYRAFWQIFLARARGARPPAPPWVWSHTAPGDNWLALESRNGGAYVVSFASGRRLRCEYYISTGDAAANLARFRMLESRKPAIENEFGGRLMWEDLPGRKACRIAVYGTGAVLDAARHDEYIEWFVTNATRLRAALEPHLD